MSDQDLKWREIL